VFLPNSTVGRDIRALRKSRNMTLDQFAKEIDRSVGFVSQLERDLSEPSIQDLRRIAGVFDVSLSFFFGNAGQVSSDPRIVRCDARRRLGNEEAGLTEELLSPDLGGSFQLIRSVFAPGSALEQPAHRNTEEAGYMISGNLDIELGGKWHTLRAGDSFRFSNEPYRWRNSGKKPAIAIWAISPPVY